MQRLGKVSRFLEEYEKLLPVRAVWLAGYRLAQLGGGDVLGLARVRDRLLQLLLERGLEPERDLDKLQDELRGILAMGVSSLKLFTTYRPNYYLDDASLLHLFKSMPDGLTAMVHCENDRR